MKMAGGRPEGSLPYHSKEHKERKERKDRNYENREKEYVDHNSKTGEDVEVESPEASDEVLEGGDRKGRKRLDGDKLLHWGQCKRSRYRESSGLVKASGTAERRVVRADKQTGQPVAQSKGNNLRPPNATTPPKVAWRRTEGTPPSATPARNSNGNCDYGQLNGGTLPRGGEKEQREKDSPSSNTGHVAVRQVDTDSSQEKNLPQEKMNFDLFKWPKVVISLTRREKEEDFSAIKGIKVLPRPKRRPKAVERNVQCISPGTWLCDLLIRERYEVREKKSVKKKPRGLKAMGSADSDSS